MILHESTRLAVQVGAGPGALPEDIDAMTRLLHAELRELGVDTAPVSPSEAPAGTKSAEALTLGALAVTVLPTMLPRLIEFLQAWSLRGNDRTVKIKATVGDRMIDIEYPAGASDPVVADLVQQMTSAIAGGDAPARSGS